MSHLCGRVNKRGRHPSVFCISSVPEITPLLLSYFSVLLLFFKIRLIRLPRPAYNLQSSQFSLTRMHIISVYHCAWKTSGSFLFSFSVSHNHAGFSLTVFKISLSISENPCFLIANPAFFFHHLHVILSPLPRTLQNDE